MKPLIFLTLLTITTAARAQMLSQFTWSLNATTAAVGPSGTSVSSSAVTAAVAAPVNYALNPGLPKADVNLTIPGSPTFDVSGIDISLYFRREESEASFFQRGSGFDFGMVGGYLNVIFTTNKGSNPGTVTVNSGNAYAIPNDHAFHQYRFKYDNATGVANMWVDNVVVYSYTGTPGYALSWSGNVVIGARMDATGLNIPVLGNMTAQLPSPATLPVDLLSFDVTAKGNSAALSWSTTHESNFEKFVVESSFDGVQFGACAVVPAAGGYDLVHRYSAVDNGRHGAIMYYRLKMVDIDGKYRYSTVKKLSFEASATAACYPNPATDHVAISVGGASAGNFRYVVMSSTGSILAAATVRAGSGSQQIIIPLAASLPKGMLLVQLINLQTNRADSFKITKS